MNVEKQKLDRIVDDVDRIVWKQVFQDLINESRERDTPDTRMETQSTITDRLNTVAKNRWYDYILSSLITRKFSTYYRHKGEKERQRLDELAQLCLNYDVDPTDEKYKIQALDYYISWTHESEYAGLYIAQREFYPDVGLDVTVNELSRHGPLSDLHNSRHVAVAQVPALELLRWHEKNSGSDLVAIASLFRKNPTCLTVRRDESANDADHTNEFSARQMNAWIQERNSGIKLEGLADTLLIDFELMLYELTDDQLEKISQWEVGRSKQQVEDWLDRSLSKDSPLNDLKALPIPVGHVLRANVPRDLFVGSSLLPLGYVDMRPGYYFVEHHRLKQLGMSPLSCRLRDIAREIDGKKDLADIYGDMIVTKREFIDSHYQELADLLWATKQGWRKTYDYYENDNEQQLNWLFDIVGADIEIEKSFQKNMLRESLDCMVPDGTDTGDWDSFISTRFGEMSKNTWTMMWEYLTKPRHDDKRGLISREQLSKGYVHDNVYDGTFVEVH